ncbi:MAG: hypothetical protein ACK5K7_00120 [Bacilli bacterium]
MILTAEQIEEIKNLIIKNEKAAVIRLVELTGCDEYDAKCLVEDYDYETDFELLLDKYWIERRENISDLDLETPKLSKKEFLSLTRIFLPSFIVIVIAIILIIKFR